MIKPQILRCSTLSKPKEGLVETTPQDKVTLKTLQINLLCRMKPLLTAREPTAEALSLIESTNRKPCPNRIILWAKISPRASMTTPTVLRTLLCLFQEAATAQVSISLMNNPNHSPWCKGYTRSLHRLTRTSSNKLRFLTTTQPIQVISNKT